VRIGALLAHLRELETELAAALRAAAERHPNDHDVYHQCLTFAVTADKRMQRLEPLARHDDGRVEWTPAVGGGSNDLLEELRILYLREQEAAVTWTMVAQAAKAARDEQLLKLATECQSEPELQAKWFTTRIKIGAPQALAVG
jgi:hypothetical protein